MNFRQLQYLIEIRNAGGIHKAANKLYLSQSALSQQLNRIEKELGISIFERGTTPLVPTSVGSHFLDTAEKILNEYSQEQIWIQEEQLGIHGKLKIGISASRATQFLPVLLPGFQNAFPTIQIEIREVPMFKSPALLASGEIDLALMISEIFSENHVFVPLINERFLIAVPKNSKADTICQKCTSKYGYVFIQELKDENFILLKSGGHIRSMTDELFNHYRIYPKILLETTNSDLAYTLCGAGYGCTFISEMIVNFSSALNKPDVYPIEPHFFKPWTLGIAYRREHYMTYAMKHFIAFTKDYFQKAHFQSVKAL